MSNKLAVREERGLAQQERALSPMEVIGQDMALIPELDQEYQFAMRKLGTIHLGVKVKTQGGREYPKATEYFVLPEELLADPDFREKLEAKGQNPDRPQMLPIMLMSDNPNVNIIRCFELWGTGAKLKCRATPVKLPNKTIVTQVIRLNNATLDYDESVCSPMECINCTEYKSGNCKLVTKLRFLIPSQARLGYWEIVTTSENNKGAIMREFRELWGVLKGRIAGVDLALILTNERTFHPKVTSNGKTTRMATRPWLLHLQGGKSQEKLMQEGRIGEVIDEETIKDSYDFEDEPIVEEAEPIPDEEPAAEQHEDAVIIAESDVDPEQARQEAINACKTIILALNYTKKQVAELFAGLGIPAIMKDMTQGNLQTLYTDLHKKLNGSGEEEPLPTE